MLRRNLFLAAMVGTTLLRLPEARADMLPDGKTFVPVILTLEGQDAFKDTTFVLAGCNSEDGRHYVAFAKPNEPLRCRVKTPPVVHALPTVDKKALEDLVRKDLGWGSEGMEVRKLLEKAPECGKVEENALVDTTSGIKEITAKYSLEKTEAGCSLKKVSSAAVLTSAAAAAQPQDTSSASPATAPATAPAPPPSAAPAKKTGCSMTTAPAGARADLVGIALGLLAIGMSRGRARARARR